MLMSEIGMYLLCVLKKRTLSRSLTHIIDQIHAKSLQFGLLYAEMVIYWVHTFLDGNVNGQRYLDT